MSSTVSFFSVPMDNYRVRLETGRTARINNEGPSWAYDYHIANHVILSDTRLRVGFTNGGATNYRYTDPAEIHLNVQYYFVENIVQPYGQCSIIGHIPFDPGENRIFISLYVFQKSKNFASYVDLLRNEKPLYLGLTCIIDESESRFQASGPGLELLPIDQIEIKGSALVSIKTSKEEVGEGEQPPMAANLVLGIGDE